MARISFLLVLVLLSFVRHNIQFVGALALAPLSFLDNPKGPYSGGSDYLPLEEDDEEFPEESIAFLRSMAQSFRSGFASKLIQSETASDAHTSEVDKDSESGKDGGSGEPREESGAGRIMKYIQQIIEGFKAVHKSISDMFKLIASAGGERLANRVASRINTWAKKGDGPAESAAKQVPQGASEAASASKPFRK